MRPLEIRHACVRDSKLPKQWRHESEEYESAFDTKEHGSHHGLISVFRVAPGPAVGAQEIKLINHQGGRRVRANFRFSKLSSDFPIRNSEVDRSAHSTEVAGQPTGFA